jgi:hypothetical protein
MNSFGALFNHPGFTADSAKASAEFSTLAHARQPFVLVDHLDAELARLLELRSRARAGHDKVGLGRNRAGHLGAENIDLFFNAGLLKTAADIFVLKDRRAEVQQALFERREAQAREREAAKGTTRKKVLSAETVMT